MRKLTSAKVYWFAGVVVGILVACGGDDAADDPVFPAPKGGGADATTDGDPNGGEGGSAKPPDCADPKNAPAIESFPTCCPAGKARCVPAAVMGASASRFQGCAAEGGAGACVPDKRLKGGKLPACVSLDNKPGACQSLCIPEVEGYKDLLPQGSCDPDERCVPCISPLDGKTTNACDDNVNPLSLFACLDGGLEGGAVDGSTGKCPHEGPPVIDPNTLPVCHPSNTAHCVSEATLTADQKALLSQCPANMGAAGRCVPDTVIVTGGRFILPSCSSVGGAEGRCLHVAIPRVAEQGDKLPQDTCKADEKCTPCYDPISGDATGICKLGCDPGPTKPAYKFPTCCQGLGSGGRCVPASFVPADQQASIREDTCGANNKCVPNELLNPAFKPNACTAFSVVYVGNYTGVCLSNCLQFSFEQSLAIAQGNCPATEKCVPCNNPPLQGGGPTGAPGCP